MRLSLLLLGVTLLLVCLMYSLSEDQQPAHIGYFLVTSSVFIGFSIYRESPSSGKRERYEIYRELAEEPKTMVDLTKAVITELQIHDASNASPKVKCAISSMLDEGLLVIEGNKIKLAEQNAAPDS